MKSLECLTGWKVKEAITKSWVGRDPNKGHKEFPKGRKDLSESHTDLPEGPKALSKDRVAIPWGCKDLPKSDRSL